MLVATEGLSLNKRYLWLYYQLEPSLPLLPAPAGLAPGQHKGHDTVVPSTGYYRHSNLVATDKHQRNKLDSAAFKSLLTRNY